MDFCIGTVPRYQDRELPRFAESLGISHYGVGDGPLLYSDPYAFLASTLDGTSSIKVGPFVTNPLTRLPVVTTNALATLNVMAPGRIFFGIGAANNATRSMGARIARLSEIEDCVRQFKGLMAGERVVNDWLGKQRDIQFIAPPEGGWLNLEDEIPIWWAAGGPKSIAAAVKVTDHVIYTTGTNPDFIRIVRRYVDEAAEAVGRNPSEIKLIGVAWFHLRRPGEGIEEAIRDGFGGAPVISGHTNLKLMEKHREELGDRIVDFAVAAADTYTPKDPSVKADHLDVFRTHANGVISDAQANLIDEYTARYWSIWGDREECAQQVAMMREAGVDIPSVVLINPANYRRDITDIAEALFN